MILPLSVRAALCAAAGGAGFIDAIAGGGGLITVPALLLAGLPPQLALGTNKGQSVFGPPAALLRYLRAGLVNLRQALVAVPLAFAGSMLGAHLMLRVRPEVLRPLVLVLLVAVALFLCLRRSGAPRQGVQARSRTRALVLAGAVSLGLGAYDGFFGPGTGTFLIVAFVALLGRTLQQASADAKAVNFAANLAAVSLFALRGKVLWDITLPMAVAQAAGGFIGAHAAVKGGDRVVRSVVLLVVVGLVLGLGRDLLTRG